MSMHHMYSENVHLQYQSLGGIMRIARLSIGTYFACAGFYLLYQTVSVYMCSNFSTWWFLLWVGLGCVCFIAARPLLRYYKEAKGNRWLVRSALLILGTYLYLTRWIELEKQLEVGIEQKIWILTVLLWMHLLLLGITFLPFAAKAIRE